MLSKDPGFFLTQIADISVWNSQNRIRNQTVPKMKSWSDKGVKYNTDTSKTTPFWVSGNICDQGHWLPG